MSRSVTLIRWLRAPRERVYAAFTTPQGIQSWMGPEQCTVPRASIDLRVGGRYRFEMHGASGAVYVVAGEYLAIEPPSRLSFTWQWQHRGADPAVTQVSVRFADKDGGTELELRHDGFADDAAARSHHEGWASTLGCLERMLGGAPKQPLAQPVVYGDPRSSYVRSARMVFVEKGVAYRHEAVPPHGEAIAALHPYGRVPALRCGDATLFETSAILHYADDAFAGPALQPADALERARMEQWISAINGYLYPTFVRELVLQYAVPRGAGGGADRAVIERALPEARRHLELLERTYGGRVFLVGDSLSLADILLAPLLDAVVALPEGDALVKGLGGVQRALAAMRERASMRETDPAASRS